MGGYPDIDAVFVSGCLHWSVLTLIGAAPVDLRQTTQLPNRLAATTRQPAGASGRLARAGFPAGHAASITVTSAGGGWQKGLK